MLYSGVRFKHHDFRMESLTHQEQGKETHPRSREHTSAFHLTKVTRGLERKLEPDQPGEKEIVVPDVKIRDIEEEGGIQRYRLTQSILDPYAKGNEEADIVLISPCPPVQIRVDNSETCLDVGFEFRDLREVEGVFCLGCKAELEEIVSESHLEQRPDRKLVREVVVASNTKGKGCVISRIGLKTQTRPKDKTSGSFLFRLLLSLG